MKPDCKKCIHADYFVEKKVVIFYCAAEQPIENEDGSYSLFKISGFDESCCLAFSEKDKS